MQNLDNSTYLGEHNKKTLNLRSYSRVPAHLGDSSYCYSHYPASLQWSSAPPQKHTSETWEALHGAINNWARSYVLVM